MPENLTTARDVIVALGGPKSVTELVGSSPQSVSNWQAANRFPARTYPILTDALAAHGYTAPSSLWPIIERAEATP